MIEVVFEGEEALETALAGVGAGLLDLRVPTQLGLEVIAAGVGEAFVEGASTWEPRKDGSPATLVDSGDMRAAATATQDGVTGSTYAIAPDGQVGRIGVDDLFHGARRHQLGYGGPDSRGRTFDEPARAFLVMTDETRTKVVEVFDMYMNDLVK